MVNTRAKTSIMQSKSRSVSRMPHYITTMKCDVMANQLRSWDLNIWLDDSSLVENWLQFSTRELQCNSPGSPRGILDCPVFNLIIIISNHNKNIQLSTIKLRVRNGLRHIATLPFYRLPWGGQGKDRVKPYPQLYRVITGYLPGKG